MSPSTNTTAAANTTTFGNNTTVMQQQVCVSSSIEDDDNNNIDAAVLSSPPLHDNSPGMISTVFTHFHSYLSLFRFPWPQIITFSLWSPRASPRSASTQIPQTLPDSHVITVDGATTNGSVTDARQGARGQKHRLNKEISTVTKLLFAVSVGAILLNANGSKEYNSVEACVERTIHLMAIILMILGIYIRLHWSTWSKWLQRVGHFLTLFCLIIIHTPLLKLPLPFSGFLLGLLSVILVSASYFSD